MPANSQDMSKPAAADGDQPPGPRRDDREEQKTVSEEALSISEEFQAAN